MCAFFAKLLNVPTEPPSKEFKDPIFLLGAMRSGTTLLMNTLSEHPQLLKVGFELNSVWTEIGGAPIHNGCLERTEEDFRPEFANNMTAYFTNYINESKTVFRKLSRLSQFLFYGSGGISYDWNNLYLLNKSPHLSNKIRYLNKMYPKSKFIVIIRSPYAQCASLKMKFLTSLEKERRYRFLSEKAGVCWQGFQEERLNEFNIDRVFPENFELLIEAWLDINLTMLQHLEFIPQDRKVIIGYETLINSKSRALESIFNRLDLKNEHKVIEDKIIARNRKIHNTTTKGNPLFKWKDHLSSEEQSIIKEYLELHDSKYAYVKANVPEAYEYWIN